MRVVFFAAGPLKNAGVRYRVATFARMLEDEGHTCVLCLPAGSRLFERFWEYGSRWKKLLYYTQVFIRRWLQLRHVPGADVVVCFRQVFPFGPPVFERLIRVLNRRMVYDIDDALWEQAAYSSGRFAKLVDSDWTAKVCPLCAHGIVGNAYLERHVVQHNPNVTVVPTCVDADVHTAKSYPERAPGEPVVLGWVGLRNNLGFMEVIEDVLRDLVQRHDLVLRVTSNGEYDFDGIPVINRRWQLEHEAEYLQEPDIGLMPLTESKRAQGKCAFKALQFMAVGTPCVVSPVGMNADIVEQGVTGFLASTPDEWREALEGLIQDAELRRTMGQAAREFVLERYSHQANYPLYKGVLETVARVRPDPADPES